MEAAFFDLDKTVIAKASLVAFGGPLHREGLISRRLVVRALFAQLIYLNLGADEARLLRMRQQVLRLTRGWEQRRIAAIVRETLEEVIDPIVYDEALDLMREHREAGRKVFIVSASPEEIVAPLTQYLGADEAVASRALLDEDGRYTGELERYCYGPFKVDVLEELAARDGIDLAASWAYSDSFTDLPMLEAVGHPVVVNPDRPLARIAAQRGWEVRIFSHRVPLRERVAFPSARQSATAGLVLAGAGAVGAGAWWGWRAAQQHRRPPTRWERVRNGVSGQLRSRRPARRPPRDGRR